MHASVRVMGKDTVASPYGVNDLYSD